MFSFLKNHFVPHAGNDHHPHMLRTEAIVFFLAVLVAVEGLFLFSAIGILPTASWFSLILPDTLIQAANASRQSEGAPVLTVSPVLQRAAELKAQDMARKGYFAHTSPEGITPWQWLEQAGYSYKAAGENLAVNFIDANDVHTAWMNSPSHRANLLNAGYTEIGIATATGLYRGNETVFVVEYFGLPAQASLPSQAGLSAKADNPRTGVALVPQQVKAAQTNAIEPVISAEPSFSPLPALAQAREEIVSLPSNTVLKTIVASPRATTNKFFLILGGIILLALLFTVLIRFELPNPRVAVAPMLFLLVILTVFILNRFIGLATAHI